MFLNIQNMGINGGLAHGKGRTATYIPIKGCGVVTYRNTLYQVCNVAVVSLLSAQQANVVSW
jgi:hypothetical protein